MTAELLLHGRDAPGRRERPPAAAAPIDAQVPSRVAQSRSVGSLVHTRPEVNRMPPQNRSRICCCRRSNAAWISSNCCSRSAGFDWRTRSNIQICTPSTAGAPHDPHVQPRASSSTLSRSTPHALHQPTPASADATSRSRSSVGPCVLCRHGLGPVGPRLFRLTDPRLSDPRRCASAGADLVEEVNAARRPRGAVLESAPQARDSCLDDSGRTGGGARRRRAVGGMLRVRSGAGACAQHTASVC